MAELEQRIERLSQLRRLSELRNLSQLRDRRDSITSEAPGSELFDLIQDQSAPVSTTDVGLDQEIARIRELEFQKQPQFRETELPFLPSAERFIKGGAFAETGPPTGLELQIKSFLSGLTGADATGERFAEPSFIAELLGEIAPITASVKVGGQIVKRIPGLAKEVGESLKRKVARGVVREGATGVVFETGRQGVKALTGEETDLSAIPKTAAAFGAIGAAAPIVSKIAKLLKTDLGREAAKRKSKAFAESLGPQFEPGRVITPSDVRPKSTGEILPLADLKPKTTGKIVTLRQIINESGFVGTEPTLALNKIEIATIREGTGLDQLVPQAKRKMVTVLNEAKEGKFDERALTLAEEVQATPRQITDTEHAGMVIKAAQLRNEYNNSVSTISELIKKGDIKSAATERKRSEITIQQLDRLTEASDNAGRETARALSIRRMRINTVTYDLASIVQRARARRGSKLTFAQNAELEGLAAKHKIVEKQLAEAEASNLKLLEEADRKAAGRVVGIRTRIATKKKGVLEDNASIKKQLEGMGFRVNDITGLTLEGSYLVGKLAVNYIKLGTNSLEAVVRRVRKDLPEISVRDVHLALNAKDPAVQIKARSEVIKRIARIKLLSKSLVIFEEAAEKGIFDVAKQRQPRATEIKVLQRGLNKLKNAARRSSIHPDVLERALRKIDELQDQLHNQFRAVKKRELVTRPELSDARRKISELRKELFVEDKIEILRDQLRTGDFEVVAKPVARRLSPQLERKQVELNILRRKMRRAIEDAKPATVGSISREALNTLRTLKATADFSGTLRQGLILSARRPVTSTISFGKSVQAFFSSNAAEKIDNALHSHPNHYLRERAKLEFTEIGGTLAAREEVFMATAIERVPIIGAVVKASNRHMTSYLNMIRASAFDDFLVKYPNATQSELKAWAQWINVTTGRGTLQAHGKTATILSTIIFAPRFAISRVQTPFVVMKNLNNPRVRKEITKDLVATTSLLMTALALGSLAGFEVGVDPRKSDWGKIKIGNTRVDFGAGYQQPLRLVARTMIRITDRLGVTGADLTKREQEFNFLEEILRFGSYKVAPSVSITNELISGKTIIGRPVDPSETALRAITPLVIEDIIEAARLESLEVAVGIAPLVLLGVGASTFEKRRRKTKPGINITPISP